MSTGKRGGADVLGVDIGGTKIAAGVVRFPEGKVLARTVTPTPTRAGGHAILAEIERIVSTLIANVPAAGIGVGLCELVSPQAEILSHNCIPLNTVDMQVALGRFGPVVLEADVRAAARAEARFGAGRDCGTFLYVTVGTGISSCLVVNGKPLTGARGAAGTVASGPMPAIEGPAAPLEEFASGPALVRRFRERGGTADTGHEVMAAATAGNSDAREIVDTAAQLLGGTIGWLINVLDPEVVVLGGGLGLVMGGFRDRLVVAARRHVWWSVHRDVPILSAALGAEAGLIGAATAAWQHLLGPDSSRACYAHWAQRFLSMIRTKASQ